MSIPLGVEPLPPQPDKQIKNKKVFFQRHRLI